MRNNYRKSARSDRLLSLKGFSVFKIVTMADRVLRDRRIDLSNTVSIFGHVRSRYCSICNFQFSRNIKGSSIGIDNCLYLWTNYRIACHSTLDKICANCRVITRGKIINCTNIQQHQISHTITKGKRARDNIECVLKALTNGYNSLRQHRNTQVDHSHCKISIESIDDDECDTLTKLSLSQISRQATDIVSEMKDNNLNISKCLLQIDKAKVDDNVINEIEWEHNNIHNQSNGNYNSQNSDNYLIRKIKQYLFIFYTKSVTTNSFVVMEIHHKTSDPTLRRHFHRGRLLLYQFWMPKYNGFDHINSLDIHRHQNPYTEVLNLILKKTVFGCADGHELQQDRYMDFNASYLSYSYKKYNTRKWMGFVLCVHSCMKLYPRIHYSHCSCRLKNVS